MVVSIVVSLSVVLFSLIDPFSISLINLLHVLDLLQPVLRTVSRVPMQGNATKANANPALATTVLMKIVALVC